MNVGIDIVLINRFNEYINNTNKLNKIFTKDEIIYIKNTNYNLSTIAGIFAAKEAFLKSIKKGINNYSLCDIEIKHNDNNAPYINLYNDLLKIFGNKSFDVSISHDGDYAIAIVIAF